MNLHEIYLASQLAKNGAGGADADLSDYYTKTQADSLISEVKAQTALNRCTLGFQRKNMLMNKCQPASRNGVNAVVNEDGSITLNGSNTTGAVFVIYMNMQTGYAGTDINGQYENNKKFLSNGEYIVSGGKSGARIQILTSKDNATASVLATSMSENEEIFSITDADSYVWTRILIVSNADFGDGVTIYPMIRLAEVTDAGYEPYKPSVAEYLAELEAKINAIEESIT